WRGGMPAETRGIRPLSPRTPRGHLRASTDRGTHRSCIRRSRQNGNSPCGVGEWGCRWSSYATTRQSFYTHGAMQEEVDNLGFTELGLNQELLRALVELGYE